MGVPYPSRNFEHLREFDDRLAVVATHAERYFVDDANTALIKTRQFAERLTGVIADQAGGLLEPDDKFDDMLQKVRREGPAPPEILGVLRKLRTSGNDAVHAYVGEGGEG